MKTEPQTRDGEFEGSSGMPNRDFYTHSRPTGLGARLGEYGQRRLVRELRTKYQIQRVLEIGSGKGIVARGCRDLGIDYLGVDGSEVAVEYASSQGLRIVQGFVPPLPDLGGFKPDIVVTIHTLSNLPSYEAVQEFVTAAGAALEPGGLFLAVMPDVRFEKSSFWDPDLTRQFPTTRHRLGRLLHAAGFDIIESRYWLDGFGSPWWYLIYRVTKLVPYLLLEGLTNRWSRRNLALYPSMWEMIYRKAPSAYVLGRKR
jgi:SAM-dependent methyltransferase